MLGWYFTDWSVNYHLGAIMILDYASTSYAFKLKEALHMSHLKADLNKQVFNFGLTLTL